MLSAAAIFPVLTVIIGGACVLLLVSTKTLRDSRDDQEKRIKQLEDERGRDKALIEGQTTQLEALRKVVTGEAHLVEITDLLTVHHSEALVQWANLRTALDGIEESTTRVADALERDA